MNAQAKSLLLNGNVLSDVQELFCERAVICEIYVLVYMVTPEAIENLIMWESREVEQKESDHVSPIQQGPTHPAGLAYPNNTFSKIISPWSLHR